MKKNSLFKIVPTLILLLIVSCTTAGGGSDGIDGPTVSVNGRLVTISGFYSEILGNSRSVRVYLLASYDSSSGSFPVLYMHDGQNIFAPGGTYGCWYVENAVNDLVAADKINEIIVVGMDSTSNRSNEYNLGGGGIVEQYAQFVITEVMPYINQNYRTLTGPSNTAIMGSSFGGNASLYFAWNHTDVFGMAGCVSSALWWNNFGLKNEVEAWAGAKKDIKFWICTGDSENDDPDKNGMDGYSEWTWQLAHSLLGKGWVNESDILFEIAHEAGHNEGAWAQRVYKPIQFFFAKSLTFTVSSLDARCSAMEMDKAEEIPDSYVVVKANYSNGITCEVPVTVLDVTSDQSALYNLNSGILTLNTGAITAPTEIGLTCSYGGQYSDVTIDVYDTLSADVTVDFELFTPNTSGNTIYVTGDFSGWVFGTAAVLNYDRTVVDQKVYTGTYSCTRNSNLTFKFCAGASWNYEELNGSGNPIDNRTIKATLTNTPYTGTVVEWKSVP